MIRALLALLVAVAVLGPGVALASCAPPVTVAEYAQRADAVVYGRVLGYEGGLLGPPSRFATFRVERVLKGRVLATIGVGIGPDAEGGPGTGPGATSVDYRMDVGSDHVLYLRQHAPAGYSTDACSGSHSGAPSGDEEAFFGVGGPPERGPSGIGGATDLERGVAVLVLVLALAAGIGAVAYARRSSEASVSP